MSKVQTPAVNYYPKKATAHKAGLLEIASSTEVAAGLDTERVVTPATLYSGVSPHIATASQTRTGTSTTTLVSPADVTALKYYTDITFSQNPILQTALTTGGVPTGATGDTNLMMCQSGEVMQQFVLGAGQSIIAPRLEADGLLISGDPTNTEGFEYNFGVLASNKHAYTVGTSGAISFSVKLKIADVTGAEPIYIGFRKQEANNANYTAYTDFAFIGVQESKTSAKITIATNLNGAGAVWKNTTDAWVDDAVKTLTVNVSAAGVVSFLIDGIAPTATQAFSFDATDVITPCIHFLHGVGAPGAIHLVSLKAGLQ